jgi:hypothetical protein
VTDRPLHASPLVVTANLPPDIQAWADDLRQRHFPPERNRLPAHVTLFHALPGRVEEEVRSILARLVAESAPPLAELAAVMDLGSGTAFRIDSPQLLALRDEMAEHFHGLLTAQDDLRPRLHVTVQNKVPKVEAKVLQEALNAGFVARRFAFAGLSLHRYLGGPWENLGRWAFRGAARRHR